MKNFNILSIILRISVSANFYDPFYREVWVNVEADNIDADSAEASYHVAHAISSAIYEAMLFVLTNHNGGGAFHTLDVEIEAEANTHTAALSRNVFPTDTAAEADPEPAAICAYSREVERYIDHCMDAMRADIAEMLKSLAAAHFGDTDGGEGDGCVVIRRSVTSEP